MSSLRIGKGLRIFQLNVEGISRDKCEVISRLALGNEVDVILLQEMHVKSEADILKRGVIQALELAGFIPSPVYGIATYVNSDFLDYDIMYSDSSNDIYVMILLIGGMNVMNVYKPPSRHWPSTVLPVPPSPCFFGGDFNSHHELWGYSRSDADGDALSDWLSSNDFELIYSPKDKPTFHSARWNSGTNPDLTIFQAVLLML